MDKYIYDENNGLWYELQGEYYLPCLSLPPEEEKPIGIWGQRHKRYLKEHRKATYTTLNALEWVRRMNNIRACAMEIVNKEIIFA